jgi:hypothetical protein
MSLILNLINVVSSNQRQENSYVNFGCMLVDFGLKQWHIKIEDQNSKGLIHDQKQKNARN